MKDVLRGPARKIVYASLAASTALIPATAFAQEHTQPEATHVPAGPQPGQLNNPEFCTNVGVKETFQDPNRRQLTQAQVSSLLPFLTPSTQRRILIEAAGSEPLLFSIDLNGTGTNIHTNEQFVPLFVNQKQLELDPTNRIVARITITHPNGSKTPPRFLTCDQKDQTISVLTTVNQITPPSEIKSPSSVPTTTRSIPLVRQPEVTATPRQPQSEQKPTALIPTQPVLTGHGYLPTGAEINAENQQLYSEKSFRDLAMEWLTVNYPGAIKTMEFSHTAIEFAGTIAIPVWIAMGIRDINRRLRKRKKT
jgi:hypothetical protein